MMDCPECGEELTIINVCEYSCWKKNGDSWEHGNPINEDIEFLCNECGGELDVDLVFELGIF